MADQPSATRGVRLPVIAAIVAVVGVVIASLAADLAGGGGGAVDGLSIVGMLAFVLVGALIVDRRPAERIGTICLGIGLVYTAAVALQLVVIAIYRQVGYLPDAAGLIGIVSTTLSSLAIIIGGPLIISRFPRRSPSWAWRRTEDGSLVVVGLIALLGVLRPGPVELGHLGAVANPLGIDVLPIDTDAMFTLGFIVYAFAYVVTGTGLIARYRHGGVVERAQIRWFAAAVAVSFGLLVLLLVTEDLAELNNLAWTLWIASLVLPPIAIAIAALRYRLYDIDRIISNTLSYGLVTLILFGLFAVVNVAFQELASQVLFGTSVAAFEGLAVVVSTLLVAALFQPVRSRVQQNVDRRFHRASYDAERTVEALAVHLRDKVDLGDLQAHILATVQQSIEPDSASLWLRARGGESAARDAR